MTQTVIHIPRVAWDGARAFVRAAAGSDYERFAGRVAGSLGPGLAAELAASRDRILTAWVRSGGDRRGVDVELGRWRVRLEELLHTDPGAAATLHDLTDA